MTYNKLANLADLNEISPVLLALQVGDPAREARELRECGIETRDRRLRGQTTLATTCMLMVPVFFFRFRSEEIAYNSQFHLAEILIISIIFGFGIFWGIFIWATNRARSEEGEKESVFGTQMDAVREILRLNYGQLAALTAAELRNRAEELLYERGTILRETCKSKGIMADETQAAQSAFRKAHQLFALWALVKTDPECYVQTAGATSTPQKASAAAS